MRYSFKNIMGEGRLWFCNEIIANIPSHTIRLFYYRHVMRFVIGRNVAIHLHCYFNATKGLTIGDSTVINRGCHIDTRGTVFIGSNVSISPYVVILTADHDLQSSSFLGQEKEVRIEDFVFIGANATILKGAVMKQGAVLGAGSMLSGNIPAYEIYGGVPAKRIGVRQTDLQYTLDYKRLFH